MTLARMLIRLSIIGDVVAAGRGGQRISIGVGVSDQEAFQAAVLPDPNNALEEPLTRWIFRDEVHLVYGGTSAESQNQEHFREDIQTRRKINDGEIYVIINSDGSFGTAITVRVTGLIRLLVWLP